MLNMQNLFYESATTIPSLLTKQGAKEKDACFCVEGLCDRENINLQYKGLRDAVIFNTFFFSKLRNLNSDPIQ